MWKSSNTQTPRSLGPLSRVAGWLGGSSSKDSKSASKLSGRRDRDDDDLDPPRPNAVVTLMPRLVRIVTVSAAPVAFA
jgi:hypothetical protein